MTIYLGFIYGILYLFFEVYPITFQMQRHYNPGVGALPFLSLLVGVVLGCVLITFTTLTRFKRKYREEGHVVPEERLIPMIFGGAALPAGLLWCKSSNGSLLCFRTRLMTTVVSCMDIEPTHYAVAADCRRSACRFGHHVHLYARFELHHRKFVL